MHFIVVGVNFKTTEVSIREKIHFSSERLPEALSMINSYTSIKGSVILSTCNRVEIYSSVNNIENGFSDTIDFISKFHRIPKEEILPFIYTKNCQSAVIHLFKVTTSLESMVIGEYQIQGQVKKAYTSAQDNNTTNNMLNKLFQTAIKIGKKVRSETKIGEGTVSVATLAIETVKQVFKDKQNFNILLLGAGKISTLTASNFQQQFNQCRITVSNRSKEHAQEFAKKFNGEVIEFEKRNESILESDIIIASTSADNYLINRDELLEMGDALKNKTRVFIDLSIPRNVDPEINSIENCFVYSIDDINKLINSNLDKRTLEIAKVEKIINEIAEDYYDWYSKQFIIPTMREIKNKLEIIKQNTFSSYETLLLSLDKKQQEIVNEMLDSYSDKIIKVIMKNFRRSASKEDLITITTALKNSFTLEVMENYEVLSKD